LPKDIDETLNALQAQHYLADRRLATALFLALQLGKPLLLEGEPGTGKTEIAKVLAAWLGKPLIRLQCYDGMDLSQAAYEWDHARQLLEIRMAESIGRQGDMEVNDLYDPRFLLRRPLLQAIEAKDQAPILLIDELDRTDEAFEAYLLELLSDFQMSIPELGTISAKHPPLVILTSNRTRELHDAVKRRCLYQWVDFPDAQREAAIVARKVPAIPAALRTGLVALVQALRGLDLFKKPGVAETIDFARALQVLAAQSLSIEMVMQLLGVLLKVQDDIALASEALPSLLAD
jgi:MoxR-like ATPase